MAIITKTRTLRPTSRDAASTYKIDTRQVTANDTLRIEIKHEDNSEEILAVFEIPGRDVATKDSIHFDAIASASGWGFRWSGIQPRRIG